MKDRIKEIREWEKMSRKEWGEKIKIKAKTIENIEYGIQKINEEHIKAIVKNYPYYAYWIITGETMPETEQTSPEIEKTRKNLKKDTL